MSHAERLQKAKAKQGKLSPEKRAELRDDILRVLDGGRKHAQTERSIRSRLIQFCGWKREKINGPADWVGDILHSLRWNEEIVNSVYWPEIPGAEQFWLEDHRDVA